LTHAEEEKSKGSLKSPGFGADNFQGEKNWVFGSDWGRKEGKKKNKRDQTG